jgi:hypothetical protein
MVDPALTLDRAIPDPLVSRDRDQASPTDDLEPSLVGAPPRDVADVAVTRIHDTNADLTKAAREEQVVLVEEPACRGHAA